MALSREELARFTRESVDTDGAGNQIIRIYANLERTDDEVVRLIAQRNATGEPTFLLRLEYERRLWQRGLLSTQDRRLWQIAVSRGAVET